MLFSRYNTSRVLEGLVFEIPDLCDLLLIPAFHFLLASLVKSRAGHSASPRVSKSNRCRNARSDYFEPADASMSFWIFSRLNEPAVWLGGYSFIVIRNVIFSAKWP